MPKLTVKLCPGIRIRHNSHPPHFEMDKCAPFYHSKAQRRQTRVQTLPFCENITANKVRVRVPWPHNKQMKKTSNTVHLILDEPKLKKTSLYKKRSNNLNQRLPGTERESDSAETLPPTTEDPAPAKRKIPQSFRTFGI